ncbi:glutamine amidotransferase-related protein [Methanobrevibacter arboriphilus]|uniref:glutamine amidotransferase-related protein n=1 Tax=Methanobrevibacter arboriphilus TaxID=39441 RepID=UPI000B30C13F
MKVKKSCSIIDGIDQDYFYFVHSYYASPEDEEVISGTTEYGFDVTAVLHQNNVFATQFHPEKKRSSWPKNVKEFRFNATIKVKL